MGSTSFGTKIKALIRDGTTFGHKTGMYSKGNTVIEFVAVQQNDSGENTLIEFGGPFGRTGVEH
ncbi:unnamed protein product [Staurois parvus]|uniref:Jacalin-type lectin domain-containing protein n=1 Tax=Staurois parvus TaxID=386267 RepID=A0ABN9C8X1_9NEOB|nr:unnamed protein product [Staurois parvus]